MGFRAIKWPVHNCYDAIKVASDASFSVRVELNH